MKYRGVAVEPRLDAWLAVLRQMGGSDLLLSDGSEPLVRIGTELVPLKGAEPLTGAEIEAIARTQVDDHYGERVHLGREVDFSFNWRGLDRIRASVFYQRNLCSLSLRRVPLVVPALEDLGLPGELSGLLSGRHGVIFVTGQTGSGKTTTMAAMVDAINRREAAHIVTIEDPVEFVHHKARATVSQREIGTDTRSYSTAMRALRRESPDVVMVDEVRDLETIASVLDIAESGRRVIAGLTVNDSVSCIERVIEVFPGARRAQARIQLAGTLLGVLYQRLLPRTDGGFVAAYELLVGIPSVRRLIREGRTEHLRQLMTTDRRAGVRTLEQSLSSLVADGSVELSAAVEVSLYPQEIEVGSRSPAAL